jgi:opacity protein-like surface antigen
LKQALLKTACALSLLGFMSAANAAMPLPSGWYVEGNIGMSKATSKTYPGISSKKNTGKGWSVNVGYKFMPYFGLEAGFARYAPTRLNSPVETVARDSHTSIDLAGKGILPFGCSGFELFAKVGVARINSQVGVIDSNGAATYGLTFNTSGQSATGLFAGVGAEYSFTPNILANVQWDIAKGNSKTGNLQVLTAGLAYIIDPAVL